MMHFSTGDFIEYKDKRYLCLEQTGYLPDEEKDKWKEEIAKKFTYTNENGTKFVVKPKVIKLIKKETNETIS